MNNWLLEYRLQQILVFYRMWQNLMVKAYICSWELVALKKWAIFIASLI